MDGLDKITWVERFLSTAPWMVWAVIATAAALALLWAIDRWVLTKQDLRRELDGGNIAWGIVIAAFILALFGLFEQALGATGEYDRDFRRAAALHFGQRVDWRQFKAQAMAESGMRARVCSHVGACGLMQIMPATAAELGVDPLRPREAIRAGVRYDRWLWERWKAPRPEWDRLAFALMSYNAGLGNVLKFQRAAAENGARNPNLYRDVAPFAWEEPREYVLRIARWCTRFGGRRCSSG